MYTHMKRSPARVLWKRGCWRSIRSDRARDEDLNFFLRMSRASWRAIGREIDELIRPA
jgi:hypothetical protein